MTESNDLRRVAARDGAGDIPVEIFSPEKKNGGDGAVVVLLQEVFGVNPHMRSVARRWAEEGYVAALPRLFWRTDPEQTFPYTPEGYVAARAAVGALDAERTLDDILAVIAAARSGFDGGSKRRRTRLARRRRGRLLLGRNLRLARRRTRRPL